MSDINEVFRKSDRLLRYENPQKPARLCFVGLSPISIFCERQLTAIEWVPFQDHVDDGFELAICDFEQSRPRARTSDICKCQATSPKIREPEVGQKHHPRCVQKRNYICTTPFYALFLPLKGLVVRTHH
jgi:hypothetical protein